MYLGLSNLGLTGLRQSFSPANIFTPGTAGLWLEAQAPTNNYEFQDNLGTTPVTAINQTVGLWLDKHSSFALGAESCTDPGFDNPTAWTCNLGWSVTGSQLVASSAASGAFAWQTLAAVTAGSYWQVTITVTSFSSGILRVFIGATGTSAGVDITGVGTYTVKGASNSSGQIGFLSGGNLTCTLDNCSFKQIATTPVSQATSTTRPTLQARVNLLLASEQLNIAPWSASGTTITANAIAAPSNFSGMAAKVSEDSTTNYHYVGQPLSSVTISYTTQFYAKAAERTQVWSSIYSVVSQGYVLFDLSNGTATPVAGSGNTPTGSITPVGGGWYLCSISSNAVAGSGTVAVGPANGGSINYAGTTGSGVYIIGVDTRFTSDTTKGYPSYQRVNTASDYDTAGFPFAVRFDGVDDNLATATFSAGTLTGDMDGFLLIKTSTAKGIAAYETVTGNWIGAWQSGGTGAAANLGAGSTAALSCFVNGAQVGSTGSITQGQLYSAIPFGGWMLLEFRDLDLHAFTAIGFCGYSGFTVAEDMAAAIFCPAQSNAVRQQIRTYLGNKVGLHL